MLLETDATGNTTLYFAGEDITVNNAGVVSKVVRHYTDDSVEVAYRTQTGSTSTGPCYLENDAHGTAQVASCPTATGASKLQRQYLDPYGNPLTGNAGVTTTNWVTGRGFLNKTTTTDTSLNLIDMGAREYDPTLGVFTSVDPLQDPSDPAQWNGYAYTENNPITHSDPTGAKDIDNEYSPPGNTHQTHKTSHPNHGHRHVTSGYTHHVFTWKAFYAGFHAAQHAVHRAIRQITRIAHIIHAIRTAVYQVRHTPVYRSFGGLHQSAVGVFTTISEEEGEGLDDQIPGISTGGGKGGGSNGGGAEGPSGGSGGNSAGDNTAGGARLPIPNGSSSDLATSGKSVPRTLRDQYQLYDDEPPLCSYCGQNPSSQLDHVVPKADGGDLTKDNMAPSCAWCNQSKGTRIAPVNPPANFLGEWPPAFWPGSMRTWWFSNYGTGR